jgi:hypothetical protein
MIPSAVGAALSALLQPDFGIPRRSTTMSNEINATESINLLLSSAVPAGLSWIGVLTHAMNWP